MGAIVGVGLLEADLKGVNWKFFAKQFLAWVVTIFLMGISCAALFAQVWDHSLGRSPVVGSQGGGVRTQAIILVTHTHTLHCTRSDSLY